MSTTQDSDKTPGHDGLGARARGILARRVRWFIAVEAVAVAATSSAALVWGRLIPPTGGRLAVAGYGVATWAILTAAGVALVVLVDQRPARRVTLPALAAVLLLLLVAAPGAWWWTFAVSHAPTGAACPECAVITYAGSGPLAGQFGGNPAAVDAVLCDANRAQLDAQAATIADDIRRATAGSGSTYAGAQLRDGTTTTATDGRTAVVVEQVALTFTHLDRGAPVFTDTTAHPWTFHLVHADGWQICQVDAPDLCTALICDRPAAPSASPSPTPFDPLDGLRSRLPCAPGDPLANLRGCPTG